MASRNPETPGRSLKHVAISGDFQRVRRVGKTQERAHNPQLLDLLAEDSWRNVYAGKLEVRPPGAPTSEPHEEAIDRL